MQDDAELLYCDEMKFPLNQTPEYFWTKQDSLETRVYNGREEKVQLTVIVLCSKKQFLAVQFCIDALKVDHPEWAAEIDAETRKAIRVRLIEEATRALAH